MIAVRVGADRALFVSPVRLDADDRVLLTNRFNAAILAVAQADDLTVQVRLGVADGPATITAIETDRLVTVVTGSGVEEALRQLALPVDLTS